MLLDTSFFSKKCNDLSAATLHYVRVYMLKQFACYEKTTQKCFQRMPLTPQPLISRLFFLFLMLRIIPIVGYMA